MTGFISNIGAKAVSGGGGGDPSAWRVIVFMGQSNAEYILNNSSAFMDAAITKPTLSSVNARFVGRNAATTGAPIDREINNTTANNHSGGGVNIAMTILSDFFRYVYPGEQFIFTDLATSGTGRIHMFDDTTDNTPAEPLLRDWQQDLAVITQAETYGSPEVVIELNWAADDGNAAMIAFPTEYSPFYLGQRWGGQSFTLGTASVPSYNPDSTQWPTRNVMHCLWDVTTASTGDKGRGLFARTTKWVPVYGSHTGIMAALQTFYDDSRVQVFASPQGATWTDGYKPGGHADPNSVYGQAATVWNAATAYLLYRGTLTGVPSYTTYTMGPGNAYLDITVSRPNGGRLSTWGAEEGLTQPDPIGIAQPVMGFEIRRGGTGATTTPFYNTASGLAPSSDYEAVVDFHDANTIRITPVVPFNQNDEIYFNRSSDSAQSEPRSPVNWDQSTNHYWRWFPREVVDSLVDAGATYKYYGPHVSHPQVPYSVGVPAAPATYFTNTSTGPYFGDPSTPGNGLKVIRYKTLLRVPSTAEVVTGSTRYLFQHDAGSFGISLLRTSSGSYSLTLNGIEEGGGVSVLSGRTLASGLPVDVWQEFEFTASFLTNTFVFSRNGSVVSTTNFTSTPANPQFQSTRRLRFFAQNSTGSNDIPGGINFGYAECYYTYSGSAEQLRKRIGDTAAAVNADVQWKTGSNAV